MTPNLVCPILICIYALCAQVFPSILSELSSDSVEQGLLLMAINLFYPLSAWFSGMLGDRYGKPPVLIVGCLLMSAPFFLCSVVAGMAAMIFFMLLFGVGGGIVESQGTALLCDVNYGRERRAVSLSQAFYCVGATAGPFLIAGAFRVVPGLTLTPVLLAVGCVAVAGAVLLIPLRRLPKAHAEHAASLSGLSFSRDLALFTISIFLYVAVEMGFAGWLVVYGGTYYGMAIADAPLLLTCFWCGQGAVRFLISAVHIPLSDRSLLLVSLVGTIVFHALAMFTAGVAVLYVAVIFSAVSMGAFWPTLVGMAGARFRGNSGVAVGVVVGLGGLAASLIQIAIGSLAKIPALGLRGALISLFALMFLNLAIVMRLPTNRD